MKYLITSPSLYFYFIVILTIYFIYRSKLTRIRLLILIPLLVITYIPLTNIGANLIVSIYSIGVNAENCSFPTGVLLPAGMSDEPKDPYDYSSLSEITIKRTHFAVRWLKENDSRILFLSGNNIEKDTLEAQILFHYVLEFDIPKGRLNIEGNSRNTYDSAVNLSAKLKNKNVTLITSQIHMRRALASFKKQGFDVCPKISNYQNHVRGGIYGMLPNPNGELRSKQVLHELYGYIWYFVTDRI